MITELNTENYKENIDKDTITLVDIWAPWCGPCKILNPIIKKISEENPQYNICKINSDENKELAVSLGIRNIPTILIYKNGEVIDKFVGVKTEQEILRILEKK